MNWEKRIVMPRYRLTWWEKNSWEVEVEARDTLHAQQMFDNWDDPINKHCYETDLLDKSDCEIEEIRRTRNIENT